MSALHIVNNLIADLFISLTQIAVYYYSILSFVKVIMMLKLEISYNKHSKHEFQFKSCYINPTINNSPNNQMTSLRKRNVATATTKIIIELAVSY